MSPVVRKAVIMARGLGTRMRRTDGDSMLSAQQEAVARLGVKALMPLGAAGRPFLDYVISALADAGLDQVCLVIGPEHDDLRARYCGEVRPARVRISFAVQPQPRGTADAVLAARAFAAADHFVVINSDNYYPADVLRHLRLLARPALVGFGRRALIDEGNIEADRVARFALLRVNPHDELEAIVEKPDAATIAAMDPQALVSMNCWLFGPRIFAACEAVAPSVRGELELVDAVQHAMSAGERFKVLRCSCPVLDLTSRADVADVAVRLRDVKVSL